ncbi:MAG: DUF2460 domain-containing protein [Pseudomonadota bacterium]
MAFHEVRFPTDISFGATGGPERRTEIVVLGSGYEERNQRWADSKRAYNAGYGLKSLDDLHTILNFFEERRGRLHGFRWKDKADFKSVGPDGTTTMLDQLIGTGDGSTIAFQLTKTYGSTYAPYQRHIQKPVSGTVKIAVNSVLQTEGSGNDYTLNYTTGVVTFEAGSIPANTHEVRAGFEFDVPARFDTDELRVNASGFIHGDIPDIPIVEIRI